MINDKTIITTLVNTWDVTADFQRQTYKLLARNNRIIVIIENKGEFFLKGAQHFKYIDGIYFYTPIYLLPFKRFKLIELINKNLAITLLFFLELMKVDFKWSKIVFWYFDPIIVFKYRYLLRLFTSIYDCVDDISWDINDKLNKKYLSMEAICIRLSKYFFVNSKILYKRKSQIRKPDSIVPLGFDTESFKSITDKKYNIKNTIGYVGLLNYRIDWKLLINLVSVLQDYQFKLYGPVVHDPGYEFIDTANALRILQKFPNVQVFNKKYTRTEISKIIMNFEICIIPYTLQLSANKYCFPMKFFEYLYCEKPVLSTKILELESYPDYCFTSNYYMEWVEVIKGISLNQKRFESGKNFVLENTWQKKIEKISKFII